MSEVQSDTATSASKLAPSSPSSVPPVHPFFASRPKLFAVMQLEVELAYRTLVAKDDPRLADLQARLEAARNALTPQELDQIHDFDNETWSFLERYHANENPLLAADAPFNEQEAKRRLHQLEALLDRLEALTRLDRDLPRVDMRQQQRLSAIHRGDNFVLLELDEVSQGMIEVLWEAARGDLTEFSELVHHICERLQQAQAPSLESIARALHRAHTEAGALVPGYIAANGVLQLPKDVREGMRLPDPVSFARCQDGTLMLVPEVVMKGWLEKHAASIATPSANGSASRNVGDVSHMSPDEAFRAGQDAVEAYRENAAELERDETFRQLSTSSTEAWVRRSTQPIHEWLEVFGISIPRLNELAAEGWHAPVESLERRLAADDSGAMIYVVSGLLCRVKTP